MAYAFDGSQYITADSPITGLPLTLAAWVYPVSDNSHVVAYIGNATDNSRIQIQLRFLSVGAFDVGAVSVNASGTNTAARTGTAVTLNTWNHACAVYASSTSRSAYLNGSNKVTDTTNSVISAPNRLAVASRFNVSYGINLIGRVADVGVWSVALADEEVASLASGVSCRLIRPQSLVFYAPLMRNLVDIRGGLSLTNVSNATVADHPRIYA